MLYKLKERIDFGLETIENFMKKLIQRLLFLLIPFVDSIMLIFNATGNLEPHIKYQFKNFEIKNVEEKKNFK